MPRTDQQRYDEALKYLKNVDAGLASDVDQKIGVFRRIETGKQISLSHCYGEGFSGSPGQHMAVRALLLCQKAYLTRPYTESIHAAFQFVPDISKRFWHSKPEIQVIDGIKSYLPAPGATAQDLANAATRVNSREDVGYLCQYNRLQTKLGNGTTICFDAVRLWLFKAGLVSLKWWASNGWKLRAESANELLGSGTVKSFAEIDRIPAGHIFNFHAQDGNGGKRICHWGVSIGHGHAIATNTTPFFRLDNVKFGAGGNSNYGEFSLESAYKVCRGKYAEGKMPPPEIIIRDIDPGAIPNLC